MFIEKGFHRGSQANLKTTDNRIAIRIDTSTEIGSFGEKINEGF